MTKSIELLCHCRAVCSASEGGLMKMRNTGESRFGCYISHIHCNSVGLISYFSACIFSHFSTSGIVFCSYYSLCYSVGDLEV